jgi:serine/threonine protein kinase
MNEVNILRYIKDSDPEDVRNIIKIKDTFIFRNQICIGFEIMDMNLYDVIKGRNFRGMKVKYIRRIALHILVGLWFLARHDVIHCDLKPENILLKKKDDQKGYLIKIIDFGSAWFRDSIIYSYVQSRFYRAPEISLGIRNYSYAIDMWSFGCMLAELYTGIPLFPAESEEELLGLIMELRGLMPYYMVKDGMKGSKYFKEDGTPKEHVALMPRSKTHAAKDANRLELDEYAKLWALKEGYSEKQPNSTDKESSSNDDDDIDEDNRALQHALNLDSGNRHHYVVGSKSLNYVMQWEDPEFVDFIERWLDLDHKRRLTAKDALKHPWIIKGLK